MERPSCKVKDKPIKTRIYLKGIDQHLSLPDKYNIFLVFLSLYHSIDYNLISFPLQNKRSNRTATSCFAIDKKYLARFI